MKLLIKFPSRSRPDQFLQVLDLYATKATNKSTSFLITLDEDDTTMVDKKQAIEDILKDYQHTVIYGTSQNKIDAINRDMDQVTDWDILLLASDDMLPEVDGYDDVIVSKMQEHYNDTDGVLWFNDGYAADRLNTLVCMGHKYYNRFGYIYNPAYKSFFCDNEFMDQANQLKKQKYFSQVLIRHQHPANTGSKEDELYKQNNKFWDEDERFYYQSKSYEYDLSVLICSLVERRPMLEQLLKEIKKFKRDSGLNIEILTDIDNREKSVGKKRNDLVARAKGKYCCFVDDDDMIGNNYFKEIEFALKDKPDSVAVLGMFYQHGQRVKPFVHSIEFKGYSEDQDAFYRPPNHLNPILTGLVKRIGFPEMNYGEDTDFAMRLCQAGLIKTEGKVNNLIYHYFYNK
jgi:glycosyltransferase involved in cell wall biosynthesis